MICLKTCSALLLAAVCCIAACEPASKPAAASTTPEIRCYAQRSGENLSALQMTIQGDSVRGYIAQEIAGGGGARGSFTGKITGNFVTADYVFALNGEVQTHEAVFKIEGAQLFQGAGSMILENGKMMLRDKANLQWMGPLLQTPCQSVEDAIDRARQTARSIRKSG
jgi:hypothetical protein